MKSASLAAKADGAIPTRRLVRYGLKLTLGLALLAWLAGRDGWQGVMTRLAGVHPWPFAVALAVYLVGQCLCAFKWGLLSRSLGYPRPSRFFIVNYLGGMFSSLFLPTSVGGDVFRAAALALTGADKVSATVSVLADRGTGVLGMIWVATLAALAMPGIGIPGWGLQILYALCAALTLGFALPFFWRPAFTRRGFLGRVSACWDHPRLLLVSAGIAFVFQAMVCVIYVLLGRALDLPVNPAFYFLLCPVVSVVALSPFSINGLGVREWALAAMFPLVEVGKPQAIAFGLAWTAMVTISSLFGGAVLFLADRQGGWDMK